MRMHNEFIGGNETSTTANFVGGDFESMFIENCKKMHETWYYRNTPITYKFNQNGHRSVDISDLNLENYIMFTGCSHTYGVGLELQNTYAYKLAEKLKSDYYNIAMPATGIDVLEYNLLMWFAKVPRKPKLLVVQMPDHSRYCNFNPYIGSDFFVESGSWASDVEEQKMVVNCEDIGFFNARKVFTYKNIETIAGIPIVYFNVYGQANVITNDLKMRKLDLARDLSHNGILSNARLTNDLYEHIKATHPHLISE